jgi:CHAD domain-containing protein
MRSRNATAHDPVTLEPCADLLRERVRTVFKHVPKALNGDAEAIHQLRVSGRRLRVTLPLLTCRPSGRRTRRALRSLRDLTRTAGTSRDLDVIAGLFAEGMHELGGATPERKVLARRLTQARRRSRARMVERLLDHDIARLRKDLRAILARGPEDLFTVLARVRERRDALGQEALVGFARLRGRFDPAGLHFIRRKARRLRYVAEVARAIRQPDLEAPRLLRDLQEQLGAIHDNAVLAAWLGVQATRAEKQGQQALAASARELEQHFTERSQACHRTCLEAQPEALLNRALDLLGRGRTAA